MTKSDKHPSSVRCRCGLPLMVPLGVCPVCGDSVRPPVVSVSNGQQDEQDGTGRTVEAGKCLNCGLPASSCILMDENGGREAGLHESDSDCIAALRTALSAANAKHKAVLECDDLDCGECLTCVTAELAAERERAERAEQQRDHWRRENADNLDRINALRRGEDR